MMLQPDSSKPLYEQIKSHLLQQIEDGKYPPHSKIPSERSLSRKFGVSRMTVKHAIQELVFNERLYTRIGKGTFVSEPPITQQLSTLTSFSEDMQNLGKSTSSRVLDATEQPATSALAQSLHVAVGAPLIRLKRLRLADGQPIAIETSHLNHDYCLGLLDAHDFSQTSLYSALRDDHGLQLSYAEQRIKARLANPEEAALLAIEPSFPLLHITRTTFLTDDTPVEYVESAYRGDRYVFRARLKNI